MPPRKSARPLQRQLSLETPGAMSDIGLDSDGDTGFDPVRAATELKRAIEEHKKRRFRARQDIEKRYQAKVAEIVKQTAARLADRDKIKAHLRQEQLARLIAAVETRDAKQRAVADQVGRFYDSCMNLTSLLQSVYTRLADDARRASLGDEPHGKAPM